ncbi:hypothetical protein [Streptomyces sp. NPDC093094]|uniref:hypothetical protein n=1 Tax=Streptomyces sp. NPDC093094 TaxID=3366026 RepID=UPI0037F84C23
MSNQPHQGYQGPYGGQHDGRGGAYDPYAQQQPYPQSYEDPQTTQQWQGQTWETQLQAPVDAGGTAGAAYPAPQQYGTPEAQGGAQGPAHGQGDAQAQARLQGWQQPQPPAQGFAGGAAMPGAGSPMPGAGSPMPGAGAAMPAPGAAVPAPAAASAPSADGSADGSGPAYGPATLAGNSRITDAQRARLEGRSPIIDPGMQPALLTALLGLLLSGAAAIGSYALLVPLVALQGLTAAGWFRLNGMWPARQGIALAFAGALAADAALLVVGRDDAPAAILGTLGVWVLLVLVLQLRSHADPDERMYGLMATVVSAALAILAAAFLAAEPDAATVGAAAVAVAVPARALPLPTPASVVVALLAAAGAGIAAGGMTGAGTRGALVGAGAAVCALIGHRVAAYDYPSRFVHFTAGVALPLAAAAPVVWVLGRGL